MIGRAGNSKLLMPMGFQNLSDGGTITVQGAFYTTLTVHLGLQEQRASRENPIGEFLGVTGPRNGVAGMAATASIPRGSDRDAGSVHRGSDVAGSGVTRCEKGL